MNVSRAFLMGAVAVFAACDPISTDPDDLIGSWVAEESLQPSGSMERIFRFAPDGKLLMRVNTYGVYARSDALSSYTESAGSFRTEGNRLLIQIDSIATWDSFYADPGPSITTGRRELLDYGTFEIKGNQLTLRYLSYPADAPVPTTAQFRRR